MDNDNKIKAPDFYEVRWRHTQDKKSYSSLREAVDAVRSVMPNAEFGEPEVRNGLNRWIFWTSYVASCYDDDASRAAGSIVQIQELI